MCDVLIVSYSVRYRLTGSSGGYNTESTSSTSATLQNLVPNAEYDIEVAIVDSNGNMSAYSAAIQLSMQGNFTCVYVSPFWCCSAPYTLTNSQLQAVSMQSCVFSMLAVCSL